MRERPSRRDDNSRGKVPNVRGNSSARHRRPEALGRADAAPDSGVSDLSVSLSCGVKMSCLPVRVFVSLNIKVLLEFYLFV